MEGSEDDAGTATSASRRASAREKDVQQAEDVDATSCYQQRPSETRASCQTPAMSEDNFDGDSVPSPSAQDVNTSTEAILDMIDEIVDGPGAPKRLPPLVQEDVEAVADKCATTTSSQLKNEQDAADLDRSYSSSQPENLTLTTSAKSDNSEHAEVFVTPSECTTDTGTTVGAVNIDSQVSLFVLESVDNALPKQPHVQAVSNPEPETSAACLLSNIASSSEVKTVEESATDSESKSLERTVKCVTSSDNRDNVTVESAESTSSDSSVGELKTTPTEHFTLSPLRRRLVRPAPSDRRPDSTVSSTVDLLTINIHNAGQSNCESVAKDVSSSSDAVPTVHANIKPEEIRNVSEISICKAETSMSPPKKIKLIRQKVTPFMIKKDNVLELKTFSSEREPCQSTSSENLVMAPEPCQESSNTISIIKPQGQEVQSFSSNELASDKLTIQVTEPDRGILQNKQNDNEIESVSLPQPSCDDDKSIVSGDLNLVPPIKLSLGTLNSLETIKVENVDNNKEENSLKDLKKDEVAPELNVCVSNSPESNENVIISETQGKSHVVITREEEKNILPSGVCKKPTCLLSSSTSTTQLESNDENTIMHDEEKKVPPIKLNLGTSNLAEPCISIINAEKQSSNMIQEDTECMKQVPKLTIKLNAKQTEEMKSPVPKVTIKPIKLPSKEVTDINTDSSHSIPSVLKLNIKPILKPPEIINVNLKPQTHADADHIEIKEQIPCITKLNIKPIPKPPEKINDVHRKSSSSEISESECSENDESTSTSDQTSASDQGAPDIVPKVTIKLGKPGTQSEGKFYTEQNIPKFTIKGIQQSEKVDHQEPVSKLKLVISQSDEKQIEKVPKLTIKNVSKADGQPLSPKLTIKPSKAPESVNRDTEIPKLKISTESFLSSTEVKENAHVPKITIKPVTRTDTDTGNKTPKKSALHCDSPDYIPVVTKLNIKPILKPTEEGETSESLENKVPVVSKLNIKPVIKPKDNEVDSSVEDVPKIIKLNIKPLNSPEENTSEEKDCDELNDDNDENSIPVITKLNIKPIVKPTEEEDTLKESENQSSEAGNSSDDTTDYIPFVTKLNIKPIIKPNNMEVSEKPILSNDQNIPVITKLNIKPLIKPDETASPSSPKKDNLKNPDLRNCSIPVVTKLNIKPVFKPEEIDQQKTKDGGEEKTMKNPPLVMKIHMKAVAESNSENLLHSEHISNNLSESLFSIQKLNIKPNHSNIDHLQQLHTTKIDDKEVQCGGEKSVIEKHKIYMSPPENIAISEEEKSEICIPKKENSSNVVIENSLHAVGLSQPSSDSQETVSISKNVSLSPSLHETKVEKIGSIQICEANESIRSPKHLNIPHGKGDLIKIISPGKQKTSVQNCTLLKKLLENTKEGLDKDSSLSVTNCTALDKTESMEIIPKNIFNCEQRSKDAIIEKVNCEFSLKNEHRSIPVHKNDINCFLESPKHHPNQDLGKELNENLTKPLEISISEKITNQSSGQDSPRIILKINKTDHGSSAKIITEETKRPATLQQNYPENTQELLNDKQSQKRQIVNSRRKPATDTATNMPMGKRLRSSRIVENTEKSPVVKRNVGKRPPSSEMGSPPNKESDLSVLETKRLKLGQLLSGNKSLTITPIVSRLTQLSPTKPDIETKQGVKTVNHSILNNENCSKNGNSKLHKILSSLQAKQMQAMPLNDTICLEQTQSLPSEVESNTSTGSDTVEVVVENCHPDVQEMIINENSEFRDFSTGVDEVSQDPLEVDSSKIVSVCTDDSINIPKMVELTPQPKKRGRPRKLPVSEGAKPVSLPVPALEERPQRSLRLMRDRPPILKKTRGRGRGRGGRRIDANPPPEFEPGPEPEPELLMLDEISGTIDPTSSRIKLPRMTEALDNMPGVCSTPLTSRRRRSSAAEMKLFDSPEPKVVLDTLKLDDDMKCPEVTIRGRGGRGSRGGGRGRTPRGRGRGRGGGRGAMYMKETMGIYGRVCGPATTTVQLFEEETCMMDDNATPAKPSHLLDEDSQSSVKSLTNESNTKMKKSKFADLFDSNKVWTAADVKEYTWPPPERPDVEHQVMMIQEQVAMFLSVKSFKRRYPELKRRTIGGEERDYVLSKGLVTEALCDLGITAVDASAVLDIMLSDYPHKYEEYRSHQRVRQLAEPEETPEIKTEDKPGKVEIKMDQKPVDQKPEPPKIDAEKTRQDMAAAAIASASEWNALVNSLRRPACADLQSLSILRRRAPVARPPVHVRPPTGFYPHALLPGQYQHYYRHYTPDQLRYYPLNTTLEAPPAPLSPVESSSESEAEWADRCSSSDHSVPHHHHSAKRKKLTKVKRSSQAEVIPGTSKDKDKDKDKDKEKDKEDSRDADVDTCRVCKLRLEANRKYTHERFLVCANCNAKLHPGCVELSADTIRKCREYGWQCAECKSCGACSRHQDDDKMLFCDLCDRGFHIYCVGLTNVPSGRWHCVECAICKSCGAREPSGVGGAGGATSGASSGAAGDAEWHHQTRRGPGGHKMYSHSLCTPCARAYRIGRYCPLCERSFIGPKGTMQLVICKLCDRQLHQECVRQTVSKLKVLDYTCAECRRGGITSRAAAVRLAPRTIATLFMAKRRFNKYAHRQYMQSRLRDVACTSTSTSTCTPASPPGAPPPADCSSDALAPPDEDEPEPTAPEAARPLRLDFGD